MNSSSESGGALHLDQRGVVIWDRGSLSGNTALNGGGAIQVTFGATISFNLTAFNDNCAANDGGAIFVADGKVALENCIFSVSSSLIS
jgi:predicted outer membrane repeat protein